MIKKFFKDITGITAKEALLAQEEEARLLKEEADRLRKEKAAEKKRLKKEEAEARRIKKEAEEVTKLTPKEIANKKKEAWVDVVGFKVNQENIRNGFYELDWNDHFIVQLKAEGYGYDGDPDEEIVSRWFRDICINAATEVGVEDIDERSSGYINVTKLAGGKAEVK
jgi:hypothetical protein